MKKGYRLIVFVLALCFLIGFCLLPTVSAKDLEPCYHCVRTGRFYCGECHNAGEVVCRSCGGAGEWKCPGEEDKGQCDNGYYVCPSCHGDTYLRSGDGEIPPDAEPGSCGRCGGVGRIECWRCHGSGGGKCDTCRGTGKTECQASECRDAKAVGWKCIYCLGTGYLLTNRSSGKNDGIQNRPAKGDKIWVNGKSAVYTGNGQTEFDPPATSADEPAGSYDKNGANVPRNPKTGRDFIWYLDLGTGIWDFDGKTVTASRNGSAVSGVIEVKYYDNVTLNGLSEGFFAYLIGDDGFSSELESAENDVAVGRHFPSDALVPFRVKLSIKRIEPEPIPPEETTPSEPAFPIPGDRNSEYDLPIRETANETTNVSVRVVPESMTEEERRRYDALTEEELSEILSEVSAIAGSSEPGRSDPVIDDILNTVASRIGCEKPEDGRIYPLFFEGRLDIGFPVRVSIDVEKGTLDGGRNLYIYRITDGGKIEFVDQAEYQTHSDGTIESISFTTSSFSPFFTVDRMITDGSLPADTGGLADATGVPVTEPLPAESSSDPAEDIGSRPPFILIGAAVLFVAAVSILALLLTRKKRKQAAEQRK